MQTYLLLLRGINVGGKNTIPMTELKAFLTTLGFTDIRTFLITGNIILRSDKAPIDIKAIVEESLPRAFKLDSKLIKVLVLSQSQLKTVVDDKPVGFGEQPKIYHNDIIFMIDINPNDAWPVFKPREGVDAIWLGDSVIYSQRLSAERTKSRLSAMMSSPLYASMTIRTWNTVTKLLTLMDLDDGKK